jgi:phosphate transport system protein
MIAHDHAVNRLEVETDELCLRILARRQPVASDLRFITIALKLVTDLERIGDLGVNICERVIELNQEPPLKPYIDLPRMAEAACGMVRNALAAFVSSDAELARLVIEKDRVVDDLYGQLFRELLTYMMEDPRNIFRATRLLSISKYIERIGDHATNLAELVVLMVRSEDIRHIVSVQQRLAAPHGILFLCDRNSVLSQMAEGWARRLLPPSVHIWSAGSQPAEQVNETAVRVMREVGIDISTQRPKPVSDVPLGDVDTLVFLCAEEVCAGLPPNLKREVWEMPDPEAVTGSKVEVEAAFKRARYTLQHQIEALIRSWT